SSNDPLDPLRPPFSERVFLYTAKHPFRKRLYHACVAVRTLLSRARLTSGDPDAVAIEGKTGDLHHLVSSAIENGPGAREAYASDPTVHDAAGQCDVRAGVVGP